MAGRAIRPEKSPYSQPWKGDPSGAGGGVKRNPRGANPRETGGEVTGPAPHTLRRGRKPAMPYPGFLLRHLLRRGYEGQGRLRRTGRQCVGSGGTPHLARYILYGKCVRGLRFTPPQATLGSPLPGLERRNHRFHSELTGKAQSLL